MKAHRIRTCPRADREAFPAGAATCLVLTVALALVMAKFLRGDTATTEIRPSTTIPLDTQPSTAQAEPRAEASSSAPASRPTETPGPATQPAPKKDAKGPYRSKAWGTRLDTQPPRYVRSLDKSGIESLKDLDWLLFGLENRTRFELRDDDLRRTSLETDAPFHLRSRAYLGIEKILDPLRFGVEFMDARIFNSDFPETTGTTNEYDFLQLFGELYFPDVFGRNQPFRFQFGRMTFEYMDRRLVGRAAWTNTINAFDGFRIQLGEQSSDWQFDFFATRPVERFMARPDHGDDERWFYGLVGAWRKWSELVSIEPYWFILDEDRKLPAMNDREIHTLGVRVFGPIGSTGFDYDVNNALQFGEDGSRDHQAWATYGELGYSFQHAWKPRVSVSSFFATGDNDPADGKTERFERLFPPNHPWSMNDYFTWQNVVAARGRIELQPVEPLRVDSAYTGYWLATDDDSWVVTSRRSPDGRSGEYLGQEWDIRLRIQLDPRVEVELGYSYFIPGEFVRTTGQADDSDFFYVQTIVRF